MNKCRILAMDGTDITGGTGFVAAGLLRELDERLEKITGKHLLDEVDVFAGTSAGGLNALFFAMHEHSSDALDSIFGFWEKILSAMSHRNLVSLRRLVGALSGQNALSSTEKVRQVLLKTFKKKGAAYLRLNDLHHKVIVPSFQLDHKWKGGFRSWRSKVFHNFPEIKPDGNTIEADELDLHEYVVDVALRTSSPPIMTPMYQGLCEKGPCYVDGGVYANNPAMEAVVQVINETHPGGYLWVQNKGGLEAVQADPTCIQKLQEIQVFKDKGQAPPLPPGGDQLKDIYLLSVGNCFTPKYLSPVTRNGMADWGYSQWMLNPFDPLVFLQLVLESGVIATHYQCQHLLGTHYNRLNPTVEHALMSTRENMIERALGQILHEDDTKEQLEWTIDWFTNGEGSAWFD